MYIVTSGANDEYASAAVSKRNGKNTSVEYIYLGKILDKEKGIYQSRERGVFTFDLETASFGTVPEDFVFPQKQRVKSQKLVSVDFGDSFFLNQFLWQSGMMDVVDQIGYGNPDTLHAMLLFYTLSGLANADAIHWYEGNIVQLLYPDDDAYTLSELNLGLINPRTGMYVNYPMYDRHVGYTKLCYRDINGV